MVHSATSSGKEELSAKILDNNTNFKCINFDQYCLNINILHTIFLSFSHSPTIQLQCFRSYPFTHQQSSAQYYLISYLIIFNLSGVYVQSTSLFWDTYIVFGTVDIFVISQPKWLKFGVQAHLFKMIGHTNFQLSISCTFKVMKLLVEVKVEQNFYKN